MASNRKCVEQFSFDLLFGKFMLGWWFYLTWIETDWNGLLCKKQRVGVCSSDMCACLCSAQQTTITIIALYQLVWFHLIHLIVFDVCEKWKLFYEWRILYELHILYLKYLNALGGRSDSETFPNKRRVGSRGVIGRRVDTNRTPVLFVVVENVQTIIKWMANFKWFGLTENIDNVNVLIEYVHCILNYRVNGIVKTTPTTEKKHHHQILLIF